MQSNRRKRKSPWRLVAAIFSLNATFGNGFCLSSSEKARVRGIATRLEVSSSRRSSPVRPDLAEAMSGLSDDKKRLVSVLSRHAGSRIKVISDFPALAEVFVDGTATCVDLLDIDAGTERLTVRHQTDGTTQTIDFGQLTSVWHGSEAELLRTAGGNDTQLGAGLQIYEDRLEDLYFSHVGRGRSAALTKKDIASMDLTLDDIAIVRKTLKAGANMARLLDSADVAQSLGRNTPTILCKDSKEGGRFKRFPSVFVAAADDGSVIVVNGGWQVVDRSTRFTTEARKFITRNGVIQTAADRRIVRKLECLAMGELFDQEQDGKLDVDVQEVLKDMGLADSPSGSKEALIKLGFWSDVSDSQQKFKNTVQPWKAEILQAASMYANFLQSSDAGLHSRSILPDKLPCFIIDNAETSFRDDGIGLRPRHITGRPVIDGMKWELLVHIADVSDIYCPLPSLSMDQNDNMRESLATLQDAARTRGYSRYDLPFGPLHLLPPVILQELSLERSRRSVTLWVYIDEESGEVLDSGIDRDVIPTPDVLTYAQANNVLKGKAENQALTIMSRLLEVWDRRRKKVRQPRTNSPTTAQASSKGHQLVDRALDLYSQEAFRLMGRRPIPLTPGAEVWRGGRFATGVLRRFVDGQAQRQILSVICKYGGKPLSLDECKEIGTAANDARNSISNLRSFRS